ncbi:MAG: excinuclease ABC subunit UvrC [Legionellales bacterium]|nr:excinuclease ABC subunit UvrC [Legionellales bacterium]
MSESDLTQTLSQLPDRPGVYQMLDADRRVIYVGKARNLKKRVRSYFTKQVVNPRIHSLVKHIHHIEVMVTRSENEALLLESNLIKKLKPKYNIYFRDDKSYPYIRISDDPVFARVDLYRGNRQQPGEYYGPYPNVGAVRQTLSLLQKIFKVRSCQDGFFRNRTRPCLQYQIKRCSAPCVQYIKPADYQAAIRHVRLFLQGKDQQVIQELIDQMQQASDQLNFELAAKLRDQITSLRHIKQQQFITGSQGDVDVMAVAMEQGIACVHWLAVRAGQVLAGKAWFPKAPPDSDAADILAAFITQHYWVTLHAEQIPSVIITNLALPEVQWLSDALSEQLGKKVQVVHRVSGQRAHWVKLANTNAQVALTHRLAGQQDLTQRQQQLKQALGLSSIPQRIECFDASHTAGQATIVACIVFDQSGAVKNDYRRFNITGITPGDDYGALRQALIRRYTRLKAAETKLPDLVIIDGGKAQLAVAEQVFEQLQISGVQLLAIAKGSSRKPGLETLYLPEKHEGLYLPADSPALHGLQQIRDEAHRFAITGHRQQRAKQQLRSVLETIPGVGKKRRQALLQYFGGLQAIEQANVEELAAVAGISVALAQRIRQYLDEQFQ